MYKPLNMFATQTDELKRLIEKYPDYPIVVMCASEVVSDDDYRWWYAPDIKFDIGEILDCEQDIDDTKVYTDMDDFEDDVRDKLSWDDEYENLSDEEFEKAVKEKLKEYEPYWKKVIVIKADV